MIAEQLPIISPCRHHLFFQCVPRVALRTVLKMIPIKCVVGHYVSVHFSAHSSDPLLMFSTTVLFFLGALVVCYYFYGAFVRSRSNSSMRRLPGPPGLPLVGNIFNMPKEFEWIRYEELGKKYGMSTCRTLFLRDLQGMFCRRRHLHEESWQLDSRDKFI